MATMTQGQKSAKKTVRDAARYLQSCGIRLPDYRLTADFEKWIGGAYVEGDRLNMGSYPLGFLRRWFAMHELGHLLWQEHHPMRRRLFAKKFGGKQPRDYEEISEKYSRYTPATFSLSWYAGPHRPKGQPSWYGKKAGGEERFCDLIAFMYANCSDFASNPPPDLKTLWNACWTHGLSHMT